ncbi:MAG: hypothetical protein Hals2KO_28840 [Halioglobus sp.]
MPTFCSKLLLALVGGCWAITSAAHAVHHNDVQHRAAPTTAATSNAGGSSIDELLQRYSVQGDDALLERAEQRLASARDRVGAHALLQQAWLAQAQHDFDRASALTAQLLRLQPGNGQAWLLEAALAAVMADRERGRAACGRVTLTVSPVAGITCFASLTRTRDEQLRAYERLQALPTDKLGDNLLAWHWSVHAQLAQALGLYTAAERYWRLSIDRFPALQARAALVDLLIQTQRPAQALELLGSDETTPALAVRRLIVLQQLDKDVATRVASTDEQFQQWLAAGDFRHAREMAMFYLDVVPRSRLAFLAASENVKIQREPEDLAILARAREGV